MKSKSNKKGDFKILDTGNFYFPLNQIGKKFKVKDTYTLEIKDKVLMTIVKETLKHDTLDLSFIARIIYEECKKEKLDKEFKNCWIVPLRVSAMGNKLEVDIDILQPVK